MCSYCPTDYAIDLDSIISRSYSGNIDLCSASAVYMCLHEQAQVEAIDDTDAFNVMLFELQYKYKTRLENKIS